jgi:tRNA-splicing ligase RtcB (3'-phosphate/5'-hydroxy nucleic acid ligase)
MSLITGHLLLESGWPPGPALGEALKRAAEFEAKGVQDIGYILKRLRRDCPPPDPKLSLRAEPANFTEAIEAVTEADAANLVKVRRAMHQLLRVPIIERGAIMPDACPAGSAEATIPVGGAVAVRNALIPSAHSADICCSMAATFFTSESPVSALMEALMASTRFGYGGRAPEDRVDHPVLREEVWDNPFLNGLEDSAAAHLADQGDGNHFAFLGEMDVTPDLLTALSEAGHTAMADALRPHGVIGRVKVLVTHHGSRGLGAKVYTRGQKAAVKHTAKVAHDIPAAAAWLDVTEPEGAAYWEALQYVARWTRANHQLIHDRFLAACHAHEISRCGNEHNFVWKRGDLYLHGKGATPAWKDDAGRPLLGLIPLNMAAPILLVLGGDRTEYLSFAPHGAGRNVSRTALMREFRQPDGTPDTARIATLLAEATAGLDIRWWYKKADFSEGPLAYKSAIHVTAQIEQFGLARVIAQIRPLGSLMAGDAGPVPWKRDELELTWKQERAIGHRADRRKQHRLLQHGEAENDA